MHNQQRYLNSALRHDPITVKVWTDGVFGASHFPIEDLERQISTSDFAALVLTSDDVVISRNRKSDAPRDNVIFELGLFMGALFHARTILICPRSTDLKIPSDLLGLTPLTYDDGSPDITTNIAPVCHDLRKVIMAAGPR